MSNSGGLPWVTLGLIAVNIGFGFVLFLNPDLAYSWGFRTDEPSVVSGFASLFLHLNLLHLLGNMVFLAAVGPLVEFGVGRAKLAVIYLIGGLAGVALFWAFSNPAGPSQLLIGASGAVAACIGAVSVRFLNYRAPILPNRSAPVWSLAAAWLVLQLIGAVWRFGDEGGGVSFLAHIGGFFVGLMLGFVLGAAKEADLEFGHDVLDRMNERGPGAGLRAAEAHLKRHPGDVSAWIKKAEALEAMNDHAREGDAWMVALRLGSDDQKRTAIQNLDRLGQLTRIPANLRVRMADAAEPDTAERLLRSLLEQGDTPHRPDALLTLAQLLIDSDPSRSQDLLAELKEKYALHGAASVARAKGLIS